RSTKPLWVREFRYDCQHRLVEFIEQRQGQKTHFAYTYDAFGRRIQKQDLLAQRPDAITRFFWQGERMVAECADDDNIFTTDDPKPAHLATYKSYLYSPGSFVPLAQLLGKGRKSEIYYYLNDHLGTPQELVNGKGQIAWSAAYRAYGNLAVAFVESVPQPLRFQGQYFDAESGLHYNRYRYYSPETARFITPDPIGLAGGLNQTQYVPNPTGWVDPLGLTSVPGDCPEPPGTGVRAHAGEELVEVYRVQPVRPNSDIVLGGAFLREREKGKSILQANNQRKKLLAKIESDDPAAAVNAMQHAQGGGGSSPVISTTFDKAAAEADFIDQLNAGRNVEMITIKGPRSGGLDFNLELEARGGRTKPARFKDEEMNEFGIKDLYVPPKGKGASKSGFEITDVKRGLE
ncbi:RHS repeat domain-containing protein, partial [Serratia fonticola]|uniref:RHS repeat domain-containing protein n=1 Tax=Serratia fonticola TaxID=47917 RepID=UPI000E2CC667